MNILEKNNELKYNKNVCYASKIEIPFIHDLFRERKKFLYF